MEKTVIIYGGKPINKNISEILYKHDVVCRINMRTKFRVNPKKDIFYTNNHVKDNIFNRKKNLNQLKQIYYFCDFKKLEEIYNIVSNHEYKEVIQQYESGTNIKSNKILEDLKCPYKFAKAPRCGYQAILYFLLKGYKISVTGFSFENEKNITEGDGAWAASLVSKCHDTKSELKILHWLHENKYVDATLCMLENHKLPLINCNYIEPEMDMLIYFLKTYGIVLIKKYYKENTINKISEEYERVFSTHKNKIEILDAEDCSNDERIFHTERYSELIKDTFSYRPLFNKIAQTYRSHLNKKTLINKLVYEEGKVKNSGAGWHRDNHDCQFKTIMYLSDVKSENGPFTWITNSSKRHIGYPEPRTKGYTTRFHDKTIEKLLNKNKDCEKIEVCGSAGDIILANTTYIHRGKVIEKGIRKAMTEYFF